MPANPLDPRTAEMVRYTSEQGGYTLMLPKDWHWFEMGAGKNGMIFSPFPELPATAFLVEKTVLPFSITSEDFSTLRAGFQKGLAELPGCAIEHQDETIQGNLLGLEAVLTFLENGQMKKRWTRIIYDGKAQLTLVAEGSSPEEFEHWLPMFYNTMMSISL